MEPILKHDKTFFTETAKKDEVASGGKREVTAAQLRLIKDLDDLQLPKTCIIQFPDPKDLLNFKLINIRDEGYYRGGMLGFSF